LISHKIQGSHNHSHFAKHFTKWLQLHQRSHYFATATVAAVLGTAEALPKAPLVSGGCLDAHVLIIKFVVHLLARKLHETSPHLSFRHIKGAFNLSMLYGLIRLGVAFTMPSSLLIIF
jgi:hypothetical protein